LKTKEYKKLHAEWYDLVSGQMDYSSEFSVLTRRIEASSQPVLELGCGTGRVLVPLLARGFDVTGIDTSTDMLDRCRATCKARGLDPHLYEQSMLDFDLPQRFGTALLLSGSLGLFVSEQDIHSMFQQVMAHLEPGGLFIYEFESLPADGATWDGGSKWTGDWRTGPDGLVIAWRAKRRYNVNTHVWEALLVIEKFLDGHLVETEANERTGRFFTVEEAVQFATSAGFVGIRATDQLTEDPPAKDSTGATVQCRKPGGKAA
jgi:SAM-dependent methyltransferase